jgi:hypothetical protein
MGSIKVYVPPLAPDTCSRTVVDSIAKEWKQRNEPCPVNPSVSPPASIPLLLFLCYPRLCPCRGPYTT